MITISKEEYQQLLDQKSKIEYLEQQLAELKRLVFGAKSERFINQQPDSLQTQMFATEDIPEVEAPKQEEITYSRSKAEKKKKQPLRTEIPSHLPRKEEIIEPDHVPEGSKRVGQEVTEILEYEPASIYVRRIVRPKYIVRSDDETTEFAIAELPSLPIPKGNAGASMLAYITVSKIIDHLPLHRQTKIFKRQNLIIAESTLGGWVAKSCDTITPLHETLKSIVLNSDYLQADETRIPVLTKDKKGAAHKGYFWIYYDPVNKLVLFDYRKSRGREGPDDFLSDYTGHLQTDGYKVYNDLKNKANIILLACMAHARRYFKKALDNDEKRSSKALSFIQGLYDIERDAREQELGFEQIREKRQVESHPILEKFKEWMDENIMEVLPKSAIGEAIAYTLKLWTRLERYTEDGRFQIDNNLIENSIRPVALGRKNYMFAGSHEAAQRLAMQYSLMGTCKINDIEPYQWLKNTLSVIQDHKANKLHELLPIKK